MRQSCCRARIRRFRRALPTRRTARSAPQPGADSSPTSSARLSARGFYHGAVDGIWGAKTDAAVRDFAQAARVKLDPAPSESLLRAITASHVKALGRRRDAAAAPAPCAAAPAPARKDPIAALIAPSKRVLAIQHALADFGYGQIKPTGVSTRTRGRRSRSSSATAICRSTGKISDRFVRELAAMTGRPLE